MERELHIHIQTRKEEGKKKRKEEELRKVCEKRKKITKKN
jgi:uncharacterized protein (DUF849 family)